jgi:hypothetical protein
MKIIMKKTHISLLILLVFVTACRKDVLDKQPLDLITENVVWNDQALIDAYLTGIYSKMVVWDKDNIHTWDARTWWYTEIDQIADESAGSGYKSGGITNTSNPLPWWDGSGDNVSAYSVIRDLNIFIEQVPNSPVEESFKKVRVAEAKFIRAYNYFAMVIRYGGVPLITQAQKFTDTDEELFRSRNSEKEIYDFIISECDAISSQLPQTADQGRPTKWAAAALKCRAALYAGSIAQFGKQQLNGLLGFPASDAQAYYQIAYDEARGIMNSGDHELYNKYPNDKVKNFRQLFIEDGNKEVIFCRPHNSGISFPGSGQGWSLDFFQGPRPNGWGGGRSHDPYLEMADEFETIGGIPGQASPLDRAAIQQGLWSGDELFGNKEPRFKASIYYQDMLWTGGDRFTQPTKLTWYRGIIKPDGNLQDAGTYEGVNFFGNQVGPTEQGTGFGILKYVDENTSVRGERMISQQDWKLFRYAEILLNLAEAAFELNKPAEALDAINQVRIRAGVESLMNIDRMKIRHERKIELAFEGYRYWDLRRWRTAVTELTRSFSGLRYQLDYTTGKYKVHVIENYEGTTNPPRFYEHNYYFPITPARIANNPNLVENPGY